MNIDEHTYIYGIWYVAGPLSNILVTMFHKEESPEQIEVLHRIRLYNDNKVFDSDDDKKWVHIKGGPNDSPEQMLERVQGFVAKCMEQDFWNEMDYIDLNCWGDDPKVFFELASRDWTNVKQAFDPANN